MGNPLAPLMNAQYAGALGGYVTWFLSSPQQGSRPVLIARLVCRRHCYSFNPFADMGVNTNDPNFLQSMMNSPEVQQQMNQMLQDPAVIDQMVSFSVPRIGFSSKQKLIQIRCHPETDRHEPSAAANGTLRSANDAGKARVRLDQIGNIRSSGPLCFCSRSSSGISSPIRKRCRMRCR